jgi:hypothetical protein
MAVRKQREKARKGPGTKYPPMAYPQWLTSSNQIPPLKFLPPFNKAIKLSNHWNPHYPTTAQKTYHLGTKPLTHEPSWEMHHVRPSENSVLFRCQFCTKSWQDLEG